MTIMADFSGFWQGGRQMGAAARVEHRVRATGRPNRNCHHEEDFSPKRDLLFVAVKQIVRTKSEFVMTTSPSR